MVGIILSEVSRSSMASGKVEVFFQSCRPEYGDRGGVGDIVSILGFLKRFKGL